MPAAAAATIARITGAVPQIAESMNAALPETAAFPPTTADVQPNGSQPECDPNRSIHGDEYIHRNAIPDAHGRAYCIGEEFLHPNHERFTEPNRYTDADVRFPDTATSQRVVRGSAQYAEGGGHCAGHGIRQYRVRRATDAAVFSIRRESNF